MSKDQIVFRPIGLVRTDVADDKVRESSHDLDATVEVYPEFQEALDGLKGFSHIFVLTYLHKLRSDQIGPLKVKPRRLLKAGFRLEELPEVGVFALDSPTRPNPIGLSLVKLLRIEETRLFVNGLDCFDGTPVLDIKPYHGNYKAEEHTVPEWYRKILAKLGELD